MKTLLMFLCSLFIILCALPQNLIAQDKSAEIQGYYNKLMAEQAAERELDKQKILKTEEAKKELLRKLEVEREAYQKAKAIKVKEEAEAWGKHLEEQEKIEAQQELDEAAIQKECGAEYGQIRIGMKLDRVQKCVAEFYLQGQVKKNGDVYDYYTRGDSWLYIKKGHVEAWGS